MFHIQMICGLINCIGVNAENVENKICGFKDLRIDICIMGAI